jgi:uncharacterized protein YegP (UPF0339 family)
MQPRFELQHDESGHIRFHLVDSSGETLLVSRPSAGRLTAQNQVAHAREASQAGRFLRKDAGTCCHLVLQDVDGSVLARSPAVADESALIELADRVRKVASNAALIDLTQKHKRRARTERETDTGHTE